MSKADILAKLKKAVEDLDPDAAQAAAREALAAGIPPMEAIDNGLAKGMETISNLFDDGEIFVPQILIAAEAFTSAADILAQAIPVEQQASVKKGKVIVHTVQGDIHDIGKNIVKTMLEANGFDVIDLGRDVPVDRVVQAAKDHAVDIVTGSALMTTTMPAQRDIIKALEEAGIRQAVKTMFGGAPVSQEWVDRIGADAYADNAAGAVIKAKELMGA